MSWPKYFTQIDAVLQSVILLQSSPNSNIALQIRLSCRRSLMGNTWAPLTLPLTFYPEHNSVQEARNHLKPNEKTFLPGTESRCSPIHSHLRVN
jgi:hypothetical protein